MYLTRNGDSTEDLSHDTATSSTKQEPRAQPPLNQQSLSIEVELVRCTLVEIWPKEIEIDPRPVGYVTEVKVRWRNGSVVLSLDQSRTVFRGQVKGGVLTITKGEVDYVEPYSRLYGFLRPDGVDLVTYVRTIWGDLDRVLF